AVSKLALDALDEPRHELAAERVIHEVDDSLTVRRELRRVADLDLDPRPVRKTRGKDRRVAPGDPGKLGRDLDADDSRERQLRRYCERASFAAADVDERVLLAVGELRKPRAHDARLRSAVTSNLRRHRRVVGRALGGSEVAARVEVMGNIERVPPLPAVVDSAYESDALEDSLDGGSPERLVDF